jgi:hypothetical protein
MIDFYWKKSEEIVLNFRLSVLLVIATSIILSWISCSPKGYKKLDNSEEIIVKQLFIFGEKFEKATYRTSINIYGSSLSGITLIKKMDSSYRVVSMSELGMKYFDFEFPFDENKLAKVHYIMEPMNKKLLVNMIIRDFELMYHPPEVVAEVANNNESDSSKLSVINKGLIYFTEADGRITEIKKRRWPFLPKDLIFISGYLGNYPLEIVVNHGKILYSFDMIEESERSP